MGSSQPQPPLLGIPCQCWTGCPGSGDGKPDRKHEAVDVLSVPQGWLEGDQRARPHLQPRLRRPGLRDGPHAAQPARREYLLLDQGMNFISFLDFNLIWSNHTDFNTQYVLKS